MSSKKRKILYAGSFDPITKGHLDIISRASKIFDQLIIGIGVNTQKSGLFTIEERKQLIAETCRSVKDIQIEVFSGLTVEFAKKHGCVALVRGIRDLKDFSTEMQMAHMNAHLDDGIETVLIPCYQEYSSISSSLVKEVASLGGDVRKFVPEVVARALQSKFQDKKA